MADQIAVPAEQGLWLRQQRGQAGSREQPADASEQDAITRLPGRLADLALKGADLMAEGKHPGAELGVGASADQDVIDHEEGQLVCEAEKDAPGTRPAAATIRGRLACPARYLPLAGLGVALPN